MHRPLLKAVIVLLVGAIVYATTSFGATADPAERIQFEIPALPGLQRYVDLLAYPSYVALALDNAGSGPSVSSRPVIESANSLRIRYAVMRFTGRKDAVFSYEAGVTFSIGVGETTFALPVTVDTSALAGGRIKVEAAPPLAKLFPQELRDRMMVKAQLVADRARQQAVLDYLDNIAKNLPAGAGAGAMGERILIDAYNHSGAAAGPGGREPGDAEPLSDQAMLIATLAIWLIVVPAVFLVRRLRARRRAQA